MAWTETEISQFQIDNNKGSIFKTCSKCKINFGECDFYRTSSGRIRADCKTCVRVLNRIAREKRKVRDAGSIKCGIYKIVSPSGSIYIGQSVDIIGRWTKQYQRSNFHLHCKCQPKLYNSFVKYGWENHSFNIIELCTNELLNEREAYWVEFYNSNSTNGMNCTIGGDGTKGYKWPEELKKKFGEKRRMQIAAGEIKVNGHPMSEKRKKEVSEFFKGKMVGEKNPFFGKKHTTESLKLIGQKSVGRYFSEEARKKISLKSSGSNNPMYGVRLNGDKNGMFGKHHKRESFESRMIILLNEAMGIFYIGFKEAADSIGIREHTLSMQLHRGKKTKFIRV